MNATHIEVANGKNHAVIQTGQVLKVTRETPCFIWVKGFNGIDYQVSKKTKRVTGTAAGFIKTADQPEMNF